MKNHFKFYLRILTVTLRTLHFYLNPYIKSNLQVARYAFSIMRIMEILRACMPRGRLMGLQELECGTFLSVRHTHKNKNIQIKIIYTQMYMNRGQLPWIKAQDQKLCRLQVTVSFADKKWILFQYLVVFWKFYLAIFAEMYLIISFSEINVHKRLFW